MILLAGLLPMHGKQLVEYEEDRERPACLLKSTGPGDPPGRLPDDTDQVLAAMDKVQARGWKRLGKRMCQQGRRRR